MVTIGIVFSRMPSNNSTTPMLCAECWWRVIEARFSPHHKCGLHWFVLILLFQSLSACRDYWLVLVQWRPSGRTAKLLASFPLKDIRIMCTLSMPVLCWVDSKSPIFRTQNVSFFFKFFFNYTFSGFIILCSLLIFSDVRIILAWIITAVENCWEPVKKT